LLGEYERAPGVTRERLYIETIEQVLASSKKVVIDTDGNGNLIYLPIDKLLEQSRRSSTADPVESTMTIERPATTGSPTSEDRTRGSR
jgi:membrane protease subunit HflK